MKLPDTMTEVIQGVRYSVATATVLADDCYWDGHNYERRGRNRYLLRGANGHYFLVHLTMWQGELNRIEPLEPPEATFYWEQLPEHHGSFEEAFPGEKVEDA